jgi:SAM-dependent methyltransferase
MKQDLKIMANEWFYRVYKHLTPIDRTMYEVDGFINLSRKNNFLTFPYSDTSILDICCGYGRHSIELAKRKFKVTGIDISPSLIEQAAVNAEKENDTHRNLIFKTGDIRNIESKDCAFDCVINMYTSFGCFDDDENMLSLKEIDRVLKPGGFVFFDLNNLFYFLSGNRIGTHYYKDDDFLYLEETSFDALEGIEYQRAEYYYKGEMVHSYDFFLKRYTFTEFKSLLQMAGFQVVNVYGDFDGSKFEAQPPSKRMIVIVTKE